MTTNTTNTLDVKDNKQTCSDGKGAAYFFACGLRRNRLEKTRHSFFSIITAAVHNYEALGRKKGGHSKLLQPHHAYGSSWKKRGLLPREKCGPAQHFTTYLTSCLPTLGIGVLSFFAHCLVALWSRHLFPGINNTILFYKLNRSLLAVRCHNTYHSIPNFKERFYLLLVLKWSLYLKTG